MHGPTTGPAPAAALAQPPDGRSQDRWLRRASLLWVALAVAATGKTLIQGRDHFVYPVFAEASRHWWADQSLYAPYEGLDYYVYSPTMAVALTPLAVLPDRLGGILWNLLSIGLLYWAMRVLVRCVLPGEWSARREAALLALVWVNSVRGVWSGHSNALLLALAVFGLAAVARRRWWRAAALLALPVYIKIWPLALVMLLMAIWPRQLVGRFCAVAAGLAAVPFLTRPWQTVLWQYREWYVGVTQMTAGRRPTLRDFWRAWEVGLGPVGPQVMLAVQLATAAAVLGWCLWQARRGSAGRGLLASVFAAWLGWQLLFGPGSERLTYLILAPAASWAVLESFAQGRLRALRAWQRIASPMLRSELGGRGWSEAKPRKTVPLQVLSITAWLLSGLLGTGAVERAILPYFPAAPMIMPLGAALFVVWLVAYHWKPSAAACVPEEGLPTEISVEQEADGREPAPAHGRPRIIRLPQRQPARRRAA